MKASTFLVFVAAFATAIHSTNAQVFEGGVPPAQAGVTEAWVQRFSNVVSRTDRAVKVVRDAAGDIIVTGSTAGGIPGKDILTIKYSGADGSVLWQQRYNIHATGVNGPSALAVDGSGNVVVSGVVHALGVYTYTVKYAAADGVLLWDQRYHVNWVPNSGTALAVDGGGNVVVTASSDSLHSYTAKYAAADGALLWQKLHSYGTATTAVAVAVDGSGNVVVTGYAQGTSLADYYTAKYAAADGALVWEQRYNGPGNGSDIANTAAVDGSGNVVVTGYSLGTNNNNDYYTATYAAADGALVWEQRYNGPGNGSDIANAVAVDGSGNVVVTGYSYGTNSNSDYYTAKYAAADGTLLWGQRYSGPANVWDYATAVTVDDSDNVVVAGVTDSAPGLGLTAGDYYTAKYAAADGVLLWERRYTGPANSADIANAMTLDASGNVVVTGQAWNGTNDDYYTAKYTAVDGAPLWEQRYNGSAPHDASAQAVAVDGNGNVTVTGVAYNRNKNGADYYTARYAAANGALLWERRYNGPANGDDQPSALAVDGSGNIVVTGSSGSHFDSFGYSISDYYTAKYAGANGALLWEKRYNGPANSGDFASALALDGNGNVVVTGRSAAGVDSFGSDISDYYTAKYAAADGDLLWERRYDGPANGHDQASALAVDASGNVVVTGYSQNGVPHYDNYTAKYAAADGALLWEKRYGPANGNYAANAVAVDASGNVVVTGTSYGGGTSDFHTVKYAAVDGALLWEKRYNGPANRYDDAIAVAVDSSGNVVVTGTSQNGDPYIDFDYYTAKYAAADGALLWAKRYSGPGHSMDWENAVAVDGSGNVVVTGTSSPHGGGTGVFHTVKYAAADGALIWEKRTGPASERGFGLTSSHRLALGSDGMVVVTGTSNGGYATVVYREVPGAVSIDLVPRGVRLRFTGVRGRSYNIDRTPALTDPWSTINTQIAPASGLLEYLDTLPHAGSGFYRIVQP